MAARARAAEVAALWFSPLEVLTAPVAQVLRAPHLRLRSQLPVLVLVLAQVLPWPQPPILAKGLAQLPGLTRLQGLAHRVLAWRPLVGIPAERMAGQADLRSRL